MISYHQCFFMVKQPVLFLKTPLSYSITFNAFPTLVKAAMA